MDLKFYKYQGCGNDFVLLDQRNPSIVLTLEKIKHLCDRRFGIGADGLMELLESTEADFEMRYYNSDGNESSFCGNGGRCIAQFAKDLGMIKNDRAQFIFKEKTYWVDYLENGLISLLMQDVNGIESKGEDLYFCTGSPHYVHFRENIEGVDLIPFARKIRYSEEFPKGINVNLVEVINETTIKMRTYERGVEDETYSCGTGVTAAAIAFHYQKMTLSNTVSVHTKGGNFKVEFEEENGHYKNIKLIGPALKVFEGSIVL
jgi:diaminopimelate epimerase